MGNQSQEINHTLFHMPDIVVVCDVGLLEELMYSRAWLCDDTVEGHPAGLQEGKAPLQTLFFHVATPTDFIALIIQEKS